MLKKIGNVLLWICTAYVGLAYVLVLAGSIFAVVGLFGYFVFGWR